MVDLLDLNPRHWHVELGSPVALRYGINIPVSGDFEFSINSGYIGVVFYLDEDFTVLNPDDETQLVEGVNTPIEGAKYLSIVVARSDFGPISMFELANANPQLMAKKNVGVDLADLKEALRIDFPDDDNILERKLRTAIAVIERYTSHSLHEHTEVIRSNGYPIEVYKYPIVSVDGGDVDEMSIKSVIKAPRGSDVTITYGVSEHANLWEAVIRVASYLYENIDINEVSLPADVQLLINQYRRDDFIG